MMIRNSNKMAHCQSYPAELCDVKIAQRRNNTSRRLGLHVFTLIELLVVISIIAMLLAILMPALGRVKKQARKIVCMTSVRSFALGFMLYGADNDGKILDCVVNGNFWPKTLYDYYEFDEMRLCPEAVKLKPTAAGHYFGGPTTAWCWNYGTPEAQSGSYGTNGWVHKGTDSPWGYSEKDHWGSFNAPGAHSNIPLMLDCTWVAGFPLDTNTPLPNNLYYNYWEDIGGGPAHDGPGEMNRYCFERHNGIVNASFLDGSTRSVPLEKLWTLKWHRSFTPQYDIIIDDWD